MEQDKKYRKLDKRVDAINEWGAYEITYWDRYLDRKAFMIDKLYDRNLSIFLEQYIKYKDRKKNV